jgi:trehalose 6-phosphate phosphatase
VFLDLDGTLTAIVAYPDEVGPDAPLTRILERLCVTMEGRAAVLTGRSLEDADRILEGRIAGVAAVHGLVRQRPDGSLARFPASPNLFEAKRLLLPFARSASLHHVFASRMCPC